MMLMHMHSYIIISHFIFLSFFLFLFLSFFALRRWGWEGGWTEFEIPGRKEGGKCTGGGRKRRKRGF